MSQYGFVHTEGGVVAPVRRMPNNVEPEIKPGFYTFCPGAESGPHLHLDEAMKLPKEVYGDGHNNVDRYFRSFELNEKNLGISLVGLKGSGKTLQAKQICIKAVEMGYPVISIDKFIPAEVLSAFLKKIEQNVVVFIDEFDKHYYSQSGSNDRSSAQSDFTAQDGFLSMLDGANSSGKKMFVLTSNNPDKMSDLFKDRPSRIRYNVRFDLLPNDVLRDYVSRNLRNATEHDVAGFCYLKSMLASGRGSTNLFCGSEMNFDTMKELVHEMSQFKETLRESWLMMKFGNHNPPGISQDPYDVDYRVYDLSTGENIPAYTQEEKEGEKTITLPVTLAGSRMAINQLHFHREDSSFLDARVRIRGRTIELNDRIQKDHYGYKELLCYDRNYQPVYIHGDIIIAPEGRQLDIEELAAASLEHQVIRDDKKEVSPPPQQDPRRNGVIVNAAPMTITRGIQDISTLSQRLRGSFDGGNADEMAAGLHARRGRSYGDDQS